MSKFEYCTEYNLNWYIVYVVNEMSQGVLQVCWKGTKLHPAVYSMVNENLNVAVSRCLTDDFQQVPLRPPTLGVGSFIYLFCCRFVRPAFKIRRKMFNWLPARLTLLLGYRLAFGFVSSWHQASVSEQNRIRDLRAQGVVRPLHFYESTMKQLAGLSWHTACSW